MNAINRIILVGNGFDLAHGLATRYADFINWYWDKYFHHLRICHNRTYSDHLCTFILNDNQNTWFAFLWSILNPINLPSGREFYEYVKSDEKQFSIHYSTFMKRICQSVELKGWVDIENEYYAALNEEYFETPEKINEEFEIIKSNLIEYLSEIQKKEITTSIIKYELQDKILAPIKTRDIAINARHQLIDFVQARSTLDEQHLINESALSIHDVLNPDEDNSRTSEFIRECINQMEEYGTASSSIIENAIDNDIVPDAMLYPNRLMFLNFNYTNTADLYIPQCPNYKDKFIINHIHGTLKDHTSIIFGYGDELDDRYTELVKLNNNDFLHNIKSIKYLETDNYRKMLAFIDSAPYQVYIMGHSCGNSDRTLLNTLFEHENCLSIKPFYYVKEDGSDNYLEMVQNISRNFTDMKLMRDRVVNKTYCEKLLDI